MGNERQNRRSGEDVPLPLCVLWKLKHKVFPQIYLSIILKTKTSAVCNFNFNFNFMNCICFLFICFSLGAWNIVINLVDII